MPFSPLITSGLPAATPGPFKSTGYAFLRHPPLRPFVHSQPTLEGKPALEIKEVAYAVYYPCTPPVRGWFGWATRKDAYWFPEPVGETVIGYERFVGRKGLGWICMSPLSPE